MLPVLRHYLPLRKALLIVSETVILTLVIGAWMSWHLWEPSSEVEARLFGLIPALTVEDALLRCMYSSFLLSALAQLAISFNELYDVRVSGSRYDRASRFVESAGSALAVALAFVVIADTWHLDKVFDFPPLSLTQRVQALVFAMLSGFVVLYTWRSLFHAVLQQERFAQRLLVLGSGDAAHELAREIVERPDTGYSLVGILPVPGDHGLAERGEHGSSTSVSPRVDRSQTQSYVRPALERGSSGVRLADYVRREGIEVVAVAMEDRRGQLPTEQLLQCRLAGIHVLEQESLYERITGKVAIEALRPSYLIFGEGFEQSTGTRVAKRLLDLIVATILLCVTWPLMIATAIAVGLDSPGPVLFTQERVGKDGSKFTLMKFRSMRSDAEKLTGPVWATEHDPRITKVGRFIRKTRLDELPQLFNVLAGSMSLVGPRPEREHFVTELSQKIPYYNQRHLVKPGLTGWAQINYRYGSTFEDSVRKLQYDIFYIKNQSLLFDLSILFNTIKTVLLRKGT